MGVTQIYLKNIQLQFVQTQSESITVLIHTQQNHQRNVGNSHFSKAWVCRNFEFTFSFQSDVVLMLC